MSNTPSKRIVLIVRCIQSGDLLDCPLFAIKPPFHPKSSRCSFSKCLYTKHFPKSALLDLPRNLMPRGKVNQNRGSGVNPRRETQKTRTGHSATRKDPAAKRWEGLVFSTAECSRGTRTTEKVVTITRFRRHLPGTGSAIAGLVRGRDGELVYYENDTTFVIKIGVPLESGKKYGIRLPEAAVVQPENQFVRMGYGAIDIWFKVE